MKTLEYQATKAMALWVMTNAKLIYVTAGLFYLLTFIAALVSLSWSECGSLVVVLSLFAAFLVGLPRLAEFVLPPRKAISVMSHDEILNFVQLSDPDNDWGRIGSDLVGETFLLEDPRLRFCNKHADEGIQNENFKQKWANTYPDKQAVGYWYDLYYDGSLINRFILVAVDGGRASLPPPDFQTGKITKLEYKVAQIHDILRSLDQYIVQSRLEVDDGT